MRTLKTLYSNGKTHLLLGDSLVPIVDTKHCSLTASSRSSLQPWWIGIIINWKAQEGESESESRGERKRRNTAPLLQARAHLSNLGGQESLLIEKQARKRRKWKWGWKKNKHCSLTASSRSSLQPWWIVIIIDSKARAGFEKVKVIVGEKAVEKLDNKDKKATQPCLFTLLSTFWGWTWSTVGKLEMLDCTCRGQR